MEHRAITAMRQELEKVALLERLVRLGATDIPHTPRMLMRQRGPAELAKLQQGTAAAWDKHVTNPIMHVADKGLNKLPAGKLRDFADKGARTVASDPLGAAITNAVPVPGAFAAYTAGKRGAERLIDRFAPMATSAQAAA